MNARDVPRLVSPEYDPLWGDSGIMLKPATSTEGEACLVLFDPSADDDSPYLAIACIHNHPAMEALMQQFRAEVQAYRAYYLEHPPTLEDDDDE